MILILTQSNDSPSTEVIKWLNFLNKKFIRINIDGIRAVKIIKIDLFNNLFEIEYNQQKINLFELDGYWLRRGFLILEKYDSQKEELPKKLLQNIQNEHTRLTEFLRLILEKKKGLSSHFNHDINKLKVLFEASKMGINVPNSIVTTKKKDLIDFYHQNGSIITKPIQDNATIHEKGEYYTNYTEEVNFDFIQSLGEEFDPSFFQKKIDKKFEIRSFFIHDQFYSMAIFSQGNEQTETDFRKYDFNKPNRFIPFKLPKEIKQKMVKLMNVLELNTGSIDLIYSNDNTFYFLEVNPVGQYSMTGYPCNYHLDKLIAETL